MPMKSPTHPKRLGIAEQRREAFALRKAGHDYNYIAAKIGKSRKTACQYVLDELARLAHEVAEDADDVRQIEVQRLDDMFNVAFVKAIKGDLKAMEQVVKIMDRRAKFLGLDSATKLAGHKGGDLFEAFSAAVKKVAEEGES